ncbi:hypothetical protein GCM10027280_31080 [Micromonospora polyrhachis]
MAGAAVAASWQGPGALWRYTPTAAGESDATNPEPNPNQEGGSYACWNWTGTPLSSERPWADCEDRCRGLIVLGCGLVAVRVTLGLNGLVPLS